MNLFQWEAQHGRFRFRPSSGCPMTSRAQLEVRGADTKQLLEWKTLQETVGRKGRLKIRIIFDLDTCNGMSNSAPLRRTNQCLMLAPRLKHSCGWKQWILGAFSCRKNQQPGAFLQGRCSLQQLVGTFCRGRVVAASTLAYAISAPAHGWYWRLFLGIGSKRWNWNARIPSFEIFGTEELRKLGAASNRLSHSLFHSSWTCPSTGWKCSETILNSRSMARPHWRPRLCWCLCTANPWERWWAFRGMGCGRHVLHPSQRVLGMFLFCLLEFNGQQHQLGVKE